MRIVEIADELLVYVRWTQQSKVRTRVKITLRYAIFRWATMMIYHPGLLHPVQTEFTLISWGTATRAKCLYKSSNWSVHYDIVALGLANYEPAFMN